MSRRFAACLNVGSGHGAARPGEARSGAMRLRRQRRHRLPAAALAAEHFSPNFLMTIDTGYLHNSNDLWGI
jgi:hypothetical protein